MKTGELIRQLQAADPSGDLECIVHNEPIFFVECQPAYYDGRMQVLIRDESNPHYSVIGAKFVSSGFKIRIHTHSIEDAILDNAELPVETTTAWEAEQVEKWRNETRQIDAEILNEKSKVSETK